jgi:hypothetical protein
LASTFAEDPFSGEWVKNVKEDFPFFPEKMAKGEKLGKNAAEENFDTFIYFAYTGCQIFLRT